MTRPDPWWTRYWRSFGFRPEVAEELQFHVDQLVKDLVAGGMTQEAAATEAARRFGDRVRVQSQLERIERDRGRRLRLGVWLAELGADVRYGVRGMLRRPGYALAAAVSLALGIGAATVVLTIVHTWLWKPLAVSNPDELVLIGSRYDAVGKLVIPNVSLPTVSALAARTDLFKGVAAWHLQIVVARRPEAGQGEVGFSLITTGNYFGLLGVRPALGRLLTDADGREHNPVVVLNHQYWLARFGGDSTVVGRSLLLNGTPFTIVGVAPASFEGTEPLIDVRMFLPSGTDGLIDGGLSDIETRRDLRVHQAIARRQPGMSVEAVAAGVAVVSRQLVATDPDLPTGYELVTMAENRSRPNITAGQATHAGAIALLALAGLVLAAAAVNVTNLVLARASTRQEELAVRLALGASRLRLVRQLLTESALLGLLGFVGAWGVARLAIGAAERITISGGAPLRLRFAMDGQVLLMSLAVAVVAGLASGFGPALIASRGVHGTLRRAGRGGLGGQGGRFRAGLVVAQVAASFVALVAGGLFTQSARKAAAIDIGLESAGVTATAIDGSQVRYDNKTAPVAFERAKVAIRAIPGVDSVAIATSFPLSSLNSQFFDVFQTEAPDLDRRGSTSSMGGAVDAGYFGLVGTRVIRGRGFRLEDDSLAPRVAVINQTAAERFWPGQEALGRQIRLAADGPPIEIVGIVPTGRYLLIGEAPRPFVFVPLAQFPYNFGMILVKSRQDVGYLSGRIREALASVNPDLVPWSIESVKGVIDNGPNGLLPLRLARTITGAIGILALTLTIVGLHGVLSYSVTQETRDIGVRIALGAEPRRIVARVLGRGGRLVLLGVASGTVLALVGMRAVSTLLLGVRPTDVGVYLAVAVALVTIAAVAAWLPARRASRLDPIVALRTDA